LGKFQGCLLVSDFDGTLYSDSVVHPDNIKALKYFLKEGGRFSIATGRGPYAARRVFSLVPINAPLLLSNGSVIYDSKNREIIDATYLSERGKQITLDVIKRFPKVGVEITLTEEIATLHENDDTVEHRKSESFAQHCVTFEEIKDANWIKTLIMTSDNELMTQVELYLKGLEQNECEFIRTSPIFIEILPKGINKACNLEKLAKVTNTEKGKIFCIGDYYNDLEMVRFADIGAFCENAPKELKEEADYIACDVKNGAVADFIYYLEKKL